MRRMPIIFCPRTSFSPQAPYDLMTELSLVGQELEVQVVLADELVVRVHAVGAHSEDHGAGRL